jgi:hypothetical protein
MQPIAPTEIDTDNSALEKQHKLHTMSTTLFKLHAYPEDQLVEPLTFLLFLKMADEQSRLSGRPAAIPSVKSAQSAVRCHA